MNEVHDDVEIGFNGTCTFKQAHDISEEAHLLVESKGGALHCLVHANPIKQEATD